MPCPSGKVNIVILPEKAYYLVKKSNTLLFKKKRPAVIRRNEMPDFDPLLQRYPSQRFPLYAAGGMVNCSVPQASAAGLEALRTGGNAMDAAVAAPFFSGADRISALQGSRLHPLLLP